VIVLGVDPGLTGALAWLDMQPGQQPKLLGVADMPTVQAKSGKTMKAHLNAPALASLITAPMFPHPDLAIIEEVGAMPGQGVTSMFRFGYVAGVALGVCAALSIPCEFIRPQAWQKLVGMKAGKEAGRLRASQLWPGQAHYFARVKDHGRADAALISFSQAARFSR
jgi:crossover junction endodeoxyribonuclease RuvC